MRNRVLFLLLATLSGPAFAAADDTDRAARETARAERQAERAEARGERQAERAQPAPKSEPQVQLRSIERGGNDRPVVREQVRGNSVEPRSLERRSGPGPASDTPHSALVQGSGTGDSVRDWRARERRAGNNPAAISQNHGTSEEWRSRERRAPESIEQRKATREALQERRRERVAERDSIGNRHAPIVSRTPREDTQTPPRSSVRPSTLTARHWNHDWRSDGHHDWQNHRRRHRSLFHLGFYYDPFGWRYRPYSIGWRMWPSYYRSSYWLNDPWMYRLPYAPPGYRWIRYYDDAVLVDTWDGQVVDVIYNFFW